MYDVAMRRRPAGLVIAALLAMLVVGGVMLFGMGKPAQAQSVPEPPCTTNFCLDKTATPGTVSVGEPITFTITQRCPDNEEGCIDGVSIPLVDTLPPDAGFTDVSVDAVGPSLPPEYLCTTSGNTVTCPGGRVFTPTQPFVLTIVATPTECGTFTNTASASSSTASVTFTVEGCVPTTPTTKEQCKNGGFMEFGYSNQGRCVSDVNRTNR
jgi:hypothetical protein